MVNKGFLRSKLIILDNEVTNLKDRLAALHQVYPKGKGSLDVIGACLDWAGIQIEHALREVEHIERKRK